MTYIGYEGTRTPGHLDLCSTIGHNIMLYANDNSGAVRDCTRRFTAPYFTADVVHRRPERPPASRKGTAYPPRRTDGIQLWEEHGHSIHDDNFFMPYECLKTAPFRFCTRSALISSLALTRPSCRRPARG